MTIAYLALQNAAGPANTNKTWNDIRVSASGLSLNDSTGAATGWSFTYTTAPVGDASVGPSSVGTGDAAWVDEIVIMEDGHNTNSDTVWRVGEVAGLDNTKKYRVGFVASQPNSSRQVVVRVNGGAEYTFPGVELATNAAHVFDGIDPVSGVVTVEFRSVDGNFVYLNAAYIEEYTPPPTVTVTQSNITPGGTISGEFSDFDTIPTTLEGIRDTNTISSAGTDPQITGLQISETLADGKYSGTFTATISSLVSTGTQQFLRFSDSAQGVADPTWRLS